MAVYLQIEGLTKSYGDRLLFGDVTFGINEGDKIGIIARNGKGKTTLLRIIAGMEDRDSGSVVFRNGLRTGYLEQLPQFPQGLTVREYIHQIPRAAEDWNFEDRMRSQLTQFGITDLDAELCRMSGGQSKRVALARILLSEPDLLILDEPTNHLDIEIIEWLEAYLQRQRVTLLMVTHDRYFLDNVCNRIIEIDNAQIYTYAGNYDYFLLKKQEREENLTAELAKVKNLLRTELDWMRRQPQARGSKARYRIDNFHQLEEKSRVRLGEKDLTLLADRKTYIGSKIFEARSLSKSFGDKVILRDWSYDFARFDKVGIVGPNGVGKSTFIKLLMGRLKPDSGSVDVGTTVRWGYYSQEGIAFDEGKKVIDAVSEIADDITLETGMSVSAMQWLTRFLFDPKDQQKYISTLSGGEKRRLYLATVLMRRPNFLVLDEPTNDLDITTLAVLEQYLIDFKGCVIIVSHDRFFLDRIVSHIFVMEGNGSVRDFPGDYSTYRHCVQERRKELKAAEAAADKTEKTPRKEAAPRVRKITFKERKELEALEEELSALEEEKSSLESEMSSGEMAVDVIVAAGRRMEEIIARLQTVETRLLELYDLPE